MDPGRKRVLGLFPSMLEVFLCEKSFLTSNQELILSVTVCVVSEDLDDLRMEGVTTLVLSGSKFNQGRPTHPAEPQAKVTLNICSRCARLQGDNLMERTEDTPQILHSPDEIIPDSLDSLPGTEETLMEEGEDFEKTSNLTEANSKECLLGSALKDFYHFLLCVQFQDANKAAGNEILTKISFSGQVL
ncbi:uncharacterized protein C8orf34 homolog [Mus pahari]|uniref:uncharacterized protein C8orf34 homolog n=1 Tax=Mus pahari TaxID=10093 RepID=UPI001114B308|nr:uncharacterized protein C8orf34 homolog [Mus pahari]